MAPPRSVPPAVAERELVEADYSDPKLECDLIMKGGITSGVIYPWLVCEIARTFRLRNVGGASAGAIAAAVAAAAEYGRQSAPKAGCGGFSRLAEMPRWLGASEGGRSRSNLHDLFQPHRKTKGLFAVLTAGLGRRGLGAVRAVVSSALAAFAPAALLGTVAGAVLVGVPAWRLGMLSGALSLRLFAGSIALGAAVVGAAVGVVWSLARQVSSAVPANGFGMCSGMSRDRARVALTEWIHERLGAISGVEDRPLTFGDLWSRGIGLQVMTTNLTHGRPYTLPFDNRHFFFRRGQMLDWFPEDVVDWMCAHGPGRPADAREAFEFDVRCRQAEEIGLLPLPAPEHLPVVVAVRMSLSFPMLLSAVPLYAVDRTREVNGRAESALRAWCDDRRPAEWDAAGAAEDMRRSGHAPDFEVNWFSDGGICSNFPVHFFDSPLPERPTFAINLRPFHPDRVRDERNEANNSFLPGHDAVPADNPTDILLWWNRFPRGGLPALAAFFGSMFLSAMNWVDNAQLGQPGYRDRIVHVSVDEDGEGGLHLNMEPEVIERLALRGREAGRKLVERFAGTEEAGLRPAEGWTQHRWLRYRSAMAALDEWLRALDEKCAAEELPWRPGWRTLIGPGARFEPAVCPWPPESSVSPRTGNRRVDDETKRLLDLARRWSRPEVDFLTGAPTPRPGMRIVPKEGVGRPDSL